MTENIDLNKNAEIEEALREFEMKSNAEQAQKTPEALKTAETPKMILWVMKLFGGLVKEEKQANSVLLGFVILTIGISIFLMFHKNENTLTLEQQLQIQEMTKLQQEQGI